jgi:arabinofuranosyltransferase
LLGLAVLFFVVLTRHHWQQICDDAFITFRYADNVLAGFGPVWNRGEPVEGYSSPLWLGLLVMGKRLGATLPTFAGALGIGFSALCLVLVHRFTLAMAQSRVVAAVACAAAALVYPLYYWAPAGLETALFTALMTFGAWSLIGSVTWRWSLAAALLGVVRPEGPLLACALVGFAGLAHGRKALRPSLLGLALAPALVWFVFRRSYYGDWLPNTYYAKATGALLGRLNLGLVYTLWALALLAATALALWLAGIADKKIRCAFAFLTLALATVVGAGGDWMWHGRMLLPVLPALVALAAAGIARAPSHRRLVLFLACALAGSAFLPRASLLADAFAGRRLPQTSFQEGTMVPAALAAARFIAARYPADALVAVNHAGALPYTLPNPALDMAGLADRHIAHEVEGGLHEKFDAAYVLARKPRVVVLNSRVRPGTGGTWYHAGYWLGETALFTTPEFSASYRPVDSFWEWHWAGGVESYIVLFERISHPSAMGPAPH